MQLYNIAILQNVVSLRHDAVVFAGAPDAGILQLSGKVLVHRSGGCLQSAPPLQDYRVGKVRLAAGNLGIYPYNIKHLEYFEPQLIKATACG